MTYRKSLGASTGSILILVIFILVSMSLFSLAVGHAVRQKIQVISRLETRQKLRKIGESAVRKSIYVLLSHRQDNLPFDALTQPWSRGDAEFRAIKINGGEFSVFYSPELPYNKIGVEEPEFRYGLTDEERKININRIKSPDTLQRLFMKVGVGGNDQARALAEAILDWRDEDDDASLSGAESYYYKGLRPPYLPRNGDFKTLPELRYVKGMTAELYEKILPFITIESSGLINLNTATQPVLVAMGLDSAICDKIVAFREGRDQREGTEDDLAFEDLSSVPQVLANSGYLDDNETHSLEAAIQSGVFTVKSENFSARVLARMKYKKQALRVSAVFDDKGVIKHWEEEFVVLPLSSSGS